MNHAVSVVIAAHNEEASIGHLLQRLLDDDDGDALHIVVACNGCSDRTVEICRAFEPSVTVLDLPTPSKRAAQMAADSILTQFPRAYIDADVAISYKDLQALAVPLVEGSALASAPERLMDLDDSGWAVRRYYRAWQRLPQVREGLFGRGVVMVSETGADRILNLPNVLSDDLAMSEAFASHERTVVQGSRVVVKAPRTVRDLVRRRVRVATGNTQADQLGLRRTASTSLKTLLQLIIEEPLSLPDVAMFLAITGVSRFASRRQVKAGDFTTWLRDESSRALPTS